MLRVNSLSATALLFAGCMSNPPVDRVAGVYTLFDPSTGMTYNIPLRHSLTAVAPAPVARIRPTISNDSNVAPFGAFPPSAAAPEESINVASAGPLFLSAEPALAERASSGSSRHAPIVDFEDASRAASTRNVAPALRLKLDIDFASAKRLVIFAVGVASLGPTGKLAVAELLPWAKQADKVNLRGGADASGIPRRNRRSLPKEELSSARSRTFVVGSGSTHGTTHVALNSSSAELEPLKPRRAQHFEATNIGFDPPSHPRHPV
jgi:hypothetical protein